MVGIVIVCHCQLAEELCAIVKLIVGEVPGIRPVSFDPGESPESSHAKVAAAVAGVDTGAGVLIMTDMFGGTPSNVSLSLLAEDTVEVLTGVNLPMLIRLITIRSGDRTLRELARDLKDYGQRNICIASELLQRKKSVPE